MRSSETKKSRPLDSTRQRAEKPGSRRFGQPILDLQRALGNQAVLGLLEARADPPGLTVEPPGRPWEREAERAADQIAGPSHAPSSAPASGTGGHAVHELLRSPGQPLDAATRAFFEPRLGHGFSQVRIHTGSLADQSARALGAEAYTVGPHVVLRDGGRAPGTLPGARLMAHELTHVVQQSHSSGAAAGPLSIQRLPDKKKEETDWQTQLDDILPRKVGLVTVIDRVTMLLDIFGEALLQEHVQLIHADAAATKVTKDHGVPGVVALYDTRNGTQLNPKAAEDAIKSVPDRYKRASLDKLRLAPRPEAPPSFFFQDPATQTSTAGGPTSAGAQRKQLHVEQTPSQVGSDIFVRFAYPATEISPRGTTRRIDNAKQAVLQALANLVADLGSLPPAADRAERKEQETVRARLGEVLKGWSKSSPLNVLIATEPSPQELLSGQIAALTDKVYVNLQDVGDPARLQAAIRLPLLMLQGGTLPGAKGSQQVQGASQDVLKSTLLHESLHALLVRQSSDANATWEAHRTELIVEGSPSVKPQFVELVRKYLIAQEEAFTYEQEASLYPPVSQNKGAYDMFIKGVASFLKARQLSLKPVPRSIPVSKKVDKKAVTWAITYQFPSGAANLTINDLKSIEFLLGLYPLE